MPPTIMVTVGSPLLADALDAAGVLLPPLLLLPLEPPHAARPMANAVTLSASATSRLDMGELLLLRVYGVVVIRQGCGSDRIGRPRALRWWRSRSARAGARR